MFHCHLLTHEDRGMMGQLVVVAPGEQAPSRIAAPGGGVHPSTTATRSPATARDPAASTPTRTAVTDPPGSRRSPSAPGREP